MKTLFLLKKKKKKKTRKKIIQDLEFYFLVLFKGHSIYCYNVQIKTRKSYINAKVGYNTLYEVLPLKDT